jgi:hypothetical protein
MNFESTRPRGRRRNGWQDEVREDGRIVCGEEWQEKVRNREEWKKLLRTARNRRILHMQMEWMNWITELVRIGVCLMKLFLPLVLQLAQYLCQVRDAGEDFDSIPGQSLCYDLGLYQSSSNFTSQSEGHFNFIFNHCPSRPDQPALNHSLGPHIGLRIRLGLI